MSQQGIGRRGQAFPGDRSCRQADSATRPLLSLPHNPTPPRWRPGSSGKEDGRRLPAELPTHQGMLDEYCRLDAGKDRTNPAGRQPMVHRRQRRADQPKANSDSSIAGWFGPSHTTRSPCPTPSRRRPCQAPNPPGQLRIGERAIFTHQRHCYPHPAGGGHPAHADLTGSSASLATGSWRSSKRTPNVMQLSVLIPIYGRSTRFGHEADHLIAARAGPEREDDQRLRWSSAWWSPPPESNRRPHPYHGTTRNRCAEARFPRSRPTVGVKVIGSPSAKLCALFSSHALAVSAQSQIPLETTSPAPVPTQPWHLPSSSPWVPS
jgi:hypothetical protein